ncbi:MAG: hypothetical protein KBT33_08640 [Prevotellaceae bacterium]|nr:hypothetical protein [Candidatus Minthosoma equi]
MLFINGQFVNLSHISKNPKGLTFHLSLCIQGNNFADDKNIYHSEEFLQSGVFYHGMLERLKDVPKLVMDIVCNRSVIADSYLYRALFCFDTTIIDENTIIKYLYLLFENKDLVTAFGMHADYEKAVKHWKKILQSKI